MSAFLNRKLSTFGDEAPVLTVAQRQVGGPWLRAGRTGDLRMEMEMDGERHVKRQAKVTARRPKPLAALELQSGGTEPKLAPVHKLVSIEIAIVVGFHADTARPVLDASGDVVRKPDWRRPDQPFEEIVSNQLGR